MDIQQLATLPSYPEESWRRTDPEIFFAPVPLAVDSLEFDSAKKILRTKAVLPLSKSNLDTIVKRFDLSFLSTWLTENSEQLAILVIGRPEVQLYTAKSCEKYVSIETGKPVQAVDLVAGSPIDAALASRLFRMAGGGIEVRIQPSDAPFTLLVLRESGSELLRVNAQAGANCRLALLGKDTSWNHFRHDIVIEAKAQLRSAWIQLGESDSSIQLLERKVTLAEGAEFSSVDLLRSSGTCRVISNVVLAGERAHAEMGAAIVVRGRGRVDYEPIQTHHMGKASSSLKVKILAEDEGKGIFQGLIRVEDGAAETIALQENKNLLLGPKAKVDASPRLVILPDDVVCKHGSATGEIDPQQLYYLQTRGFTEAEARILLVRGFVADGLSVLPVDDPLFSLCEICLQS